jgi:ABC-2 type transport system permease protein
MPPLCWWLCDSVSRAAFLLTAAYLVRDRDVKLRVYPGLAPMLVMPIRFLVQDHGRAEAGAFGSAFATMFLGLIPVLGLTLVPYPQQWQASDPFRPAPIAGPAPLRHGARRTVLCLPTVPVLVIFGVVAWALRGKASSLALLLVELVVVSVLYVVLRASLSAARWPPTE